MVSVNTFSLSFLSTFLFFLRLALADQDCCYKASNGFGLITYQISWASATQTATCAVSGLDASLYTCSVAMSLDGTSIQASAVATFATTTPIHTLNMTVGMNNDGCSLLADSQVQKSMDPSFLWNEGDTGYSTAHGACTF